ncbi:MAG: amidohydrolase family protein [Candidatus Schekmanbacteria bacterium]|nr:amidohydrolase family protein [Candidatus Schekmanbacteria bacterium]
MTAESEVPTHGVSGGLVLSNATVVKMDAARRVFRGDVVVRGDRVAQLGPGVTAPRAQGPWRLIDCTGRVVLPGFVQTHVHLTQTLFRHLACDLDLLSWLRRRIWPLEAAHDEQTNRAAARLGVAELLTGGTTTILSMETVHHTEATFEAAHELGIRAHIGKAMMDQGEGVPAELRESTDESLAETRRLCSRWHGAAGGRLHYAVAPRFLFSCSERLLRRAARLAEECGCLLHTHASESKDEVALSLAAFGCGCIEALNHVAGCASTGTVLAHCVHPQAGEIAILRELDAAVAHCPSSNLKLASGIAPVRAYLDAGIPVGLGADGAPCNDRLDALGEMRLAALLGQLKSGAGSLTAREVVELATVGGARSLRADHEIGSLEVGKKADLVVLDPGRGYSSAPPPRFTGDTDAAENGSSAAAEELYAWIAFTCSPQQVEHVFVDGAHVVRGGDLMSAHTGGIREEAARAIALCRRRAGI